MIFKCKEKALVLEADIFTEIRDFIASKLDVVQNTANAIATVVCFVRCNVSLKICMKA